MKLSSSRASVPGRKRLLEDEGSSMIEMAVGLPVFFMLTFGFINFALVLFGLCNTCFASRAALRYASLHSSTSYTPTTQQTLNQIVAPFVFRYPSNTYSVTYSYGSGGNVVGQTLSVGVRITYNLRVPGYTLNGLVFNSAASGLVVQ